MLRLRHCRVALILALAACGARTDITLLPFATATGAGTRTTDAATSHTPDSTPFTDASPIASDPCPSGVLLHAPLPMVGNCSTRDGRARVVGPKAPHVTWTAAVPPPGGDSELSLGMVAADATGSVYLLSANATNVALTKVDAASGAFDWSTPLSPVGEFAPALYLTAGGALDAFAQPEGAPVALDTVDTTTGGATATPLHAGPSDAGGPIGLPAIGADGSFYVAYTPAEGAEATLFYPVVSRVRPDGSVAWTSHTVYGAGLTGVEYQSPVALGPGDLVIVAQTSAQLGYSTVTGLDPATGSVKWSSTLPGDLGSPAVAPDGSIAIVASTPSTQALYVLEPDGPVRHRVNVAATGSTFAMPTVTILAIGLDGTVVLGGESLFAVDSTGQKTWTAPGPDGGPNGSLLGSASIDATGTVIATYTTGIVGLDLATGAARWTLDPPASVRCIGSATLTSSGGLVATACGTSRIAPGLAGIFGASD